MSPLETVSPRCAGDEVANGAKWHDLLLRLLEFCRTTYQAWESYGGSWEPELSPDLSWEEAWERWEEIHASHKEAVCLAVRQLPGREALSNCPREVLYFLFLRCRAAADHVRAVCTWREDQPVSLVPFPSLSEAEVANWYLMEWAARHAVNKAFPEENGR